MTDRVSLVSLRLDGGTQPRAAIDQNTVNDYRDALLAGATFPPVVVFYDGADHWLADGFHRVHAHIMRRLPDIEADVRQGTRRDAVLFSVGANASHGLRRTNEDKRRAVSTLLTDDEWARWSDREIARKCEVGADMVGRLRPADTVVERQYVHPKTGHRAVMRTSNIGKPSAAAAPVGRGYYAMDPESGNLGNVAAEASSTPRSTAAPIVIGDATLYNGDCRDILPTLGPVEHILCDPPYEEQAHKAQIRTHADHKSGERSRLEFDPITEDLRRLVAAEARRLSRGWFLAFCQFEAIGTWRDAILTAGAAYRSVGGWVKPDSSPQFNGNKPAVAAEAFVLGWCGSGDSKWNSRGKRGVYTANVNTGRHGGHQTEKPLALMRELLADFTNPGETILDPFMGIGSLGVACREMGRRYIGIELDPTYFAIACERMSAMPANDNSAIDLAA